MSKIFKADRAHLLPSFQGIFSLSKQDQTLLLFYALGWRAKKCVLWFLRNGWDPNARVEKGNSLIFTSCLYSCAYQEMIRAGAIVKMSDYDWEDLHFDWRNSRDSIRSFYAGVYKMFLLGLKLPNNHPKIPSPCYDAYRVILAREKACKEACYTFIRINGLPKDLVCWMLKTFILPSKREDYWSDLPMPEGFV